MSIDDILVDRIKAICITDAKEKAREILQGQATEAWAMVCEWEGKAADALFVKVSPENPHRRTLDDVMRKAIEIGVEVRVRP